MKKIPSSYYLIFLSSGFLIGIFFASFLQFNWQILIIGFFSLSVLILLFYKDKKIILIIFSAIAILVGIFYYHFYTREEKNNINKFYQKEVNLIAQVVDDQDIRGDKIKLTIQVYKIKTIDEIDFQNVQGKILLNLNRYPEYQFKNWLEIKGKIIEPQKYPDFDYKSYLSRYGISALMNYPEIIVINQPEYIKQNIFSKSWLNLKFVLFKTKNAFVGKINQILPEPQAAFLAGLLIGAKRAIPENLMDAFNKTGVTHIVVISGYNITIIIKAFMVLTRRWSKKLSIILAILGIFLFTFMVGAEAPVLRAALMALFIIWAERIGRKSDVAIALILTALIMVFINPKIMRFDLGFQLSFLAVIGLIYFSPILEDLISKNRYRKYFPEIIKEPFIATMSAQIFVVPIILYNFHRLSLIAPLANVLILPLIPITMFFGFIAILAAFIWLGFGQILGWISWLFLTYMIWIAMSLSKLPISSVENIQISWIALLLWYVFLILFIVWYYRKKLKLKEAKGE